VIGVVDASAFLRLFVPDGPLPAGFEPFMRGVERGEHAAIAPHLIQAECGNVLLRKASRGELGQAEATALLELVERAPLRLVDHGPLLSSAFTLAQAHGLSLYDALYLALARERGARLFTVDDRLASAAGRLGLA
jgi:predicted nucleic acid-binding protein